MAANIHTKGYWISPEQLLIRAPAQYHCVQCFQILIISCCPGAFVTFKANLGQRNNTILLPGAGVQRDANSAYVLVIDKDGKVIRKNVTTTGMKDNQWLITAGLSSGDRVIVDGLQKVKEGAPAKGIPWKPDLISSSAHAAAKTPTHTAKTEQ